MDEQPSTTAPEAAADSRTAAALGTGAAVAVGFLAFVEMCSGLLQGYVPVLAANIGALYGVGAADLSWLNVVLLLSSALSVPILSKCGDLFGHRRVLRIAVVLVALGSILVAVAPDYGLFLAGRALQGPFAAFLPLEVAIVRGRVTGAATRRGIGYLVGALTVGGSIGALTAGSINSWMPSVHWTLAVPAALFAVCAVVCFALVPPSAPVQHGAEGRARIDVVGFAGLSIALGALLLGLALGPTHGWSAPWVIGLLIAAVLTGALWVWYELRIPVPAIDLRLVASSGLGLPFLAALCFGVGIYGAQVANSTFLASVPAVAGYGLGLTSLQIGFVTTALTVSAALFAAWCARMARRLGLHIPIAAGLALIAAGYLLLIPLHAHVWQFVASQLIAGSGVGLASGAYPALVIEASPASDVGIANGVYNTLRALGGALAGAVFAALLTAMVVPAKGMPSLSGYLLVWAILALLLLASAAVVLVARRGARSPSHLPLAAEPSGDAAPVAS